MMRLVFFGTSDFAEKPLIRLSETDHEILAVVTQPDRPRGRGMKLQPSPAKVVAQGLGLSVEQPEDPNSQDFAERLKMLGPDVIVVAAYAHKLGVALLELPPEGCINIHPSLLPLHRGAAPVNWAIIRGDRKTGVTIMRMNERFDAGEILEQEPVEIGDDETAGELQDRLSGLGADLLIRTLEEMELGEVSGTEQEERKATRAPIIRKSDCEVRWSETALQIKNLIRGLYPKPGAYSYYRGRVIKLARADAVSGHVEGEPGEIVGTEEGIDIASGKGIVRVVSLRPEGKREMSWIDFKNGFRPRCGERFGGMATQSL